jgi:hypothetical protein
LRRYDEFCFCSERFEIKADAFRATSSFWLLFAAPKSDKTTSVSQSETKKVQAKPGLKKLK